MIKDSYVILQSKFKKNLFGSGEIRTRASEETGALNQRLRPLGHATLLFPINKFYVFEDIARTI